MLWRARRDSVPRCLAIVELEHFLTGTIAVVHVCRIKPYADASVGTKAQMKEVVEFTDRIWDSVNKIKDIREAADDFEVLVGRKGLTAAGVSLEPLAVMFKDDSSKFRDSFNHRRLNQTFRRVHASIGL